MNNTYEELYQMAKSGIKPSNTEKFLELLKLLFKENSNAEDMIMHLYKDAINEVAKECIFGFILGYLSGYRKKDAKVERKEERIVNTMFIVEGRTGHIDWNSTDCNKCDHLKCEGCEKIFSLYINGNFEGNYDSQKEAEDAAKEILGG
jgi:hypothetical protein